MNDGLFGIYGAPAFSPERIPPNPVPPMKTNYASREAGRIVRILAYSFVFLAFAGVHETLRPISRTVGAACGKVVEFAVFR